MKKLTLKFLVILIFSSCNSNSQKQKENEEKAIMDSVAKAVKQSMDSAATALKQSVEQKISLEKKVDTISQQAQLVKENIKQAMATLEGEKSKLESVKDFHLLRTSSEKAKEIKNQSLVILNLQDKIDSLQKEYESFYSQKNQLLQELRNFK